MSGERGEGRERVRMKNCGNRAVAVVIMVLWVRYRYKLT